MKLLKRAPLLLLLFVLSCKDSAVLLKELHTISDTIKTQYAPDKRVAIFDVNFEDINDIIIVSGITDSKEAHQKLVTNLKSLDIAFINNIRVLPDTVVGPKKFAVARNSVINIRSNPKHSAELGTQGLLGMSLKILDKKGDFYRIQTPDSYISWVDKGGIQKMNKKQFDAWNTSEKVIFIKTNGFVYAAASEKSPIVSDITLGALLQYRSENNYFFGVKYPDNRIGFIKKTEAIRYNSWLKNTALTGEKIEKTAKKMNGFPYLWGGTSTKGMDCSGFTKMAYLMNGFIIPRDASQQINAGKKVDRDLNFKTLEKGDLLFFGTKATAEKKQRVVHVGIWLGNQKMEFIHASGNVHISSMDKAEAHYDDFNKKRYLGSRRYIGSSNKNIIALRTKLKP